MAQQIDDFMRLTHVPCHHQQQGGHRRQRQPGEQRGEDQQRHDHQQGVDHGGNRRCGAGAHVRRRAGNRRGGGDPAEERRNDVAQPLANQLAVGFMLGTGHTVEHHRAQQRFNRAEHRHGEGGRQQRLQRSPAQGKAGARHIPGQHQLRQQLRNAVALSAVRQLIVKLRADRRHIAAEQVDHQHHRAAGQQRGEVARQTDTQPRPEDQGAEGDDADGGVPDVNGRQGHGQRGHFLQIMLRHMGHLQAEKILNLHGTDSDTDPGGEAEGDRQRDIFDQAAKARQAEKN